MGKLYRTVFKIEVLSDRPTEDLDIQEIAANIVDGDFSGEVSVDTVEKLSKRAMAKALQNQGSDLEFLLGDDGWKYNLDSGDEITLPFGDITKLTIQTIEYLNDEIVCITDKDGHKIEVNIEEIS